MFCILLGGSGFDGHRTGDHLERSASSLRLPGCCPACCLLLPLPLLFLVGRRRRGRSARPVDSVEGWSTSSPNTGPNDAAAWTSLKRSVLDKQASYGAPATSGLQLHRHQSTHHYLAPIGPFTPSTILYHETTFSLPSFSSLLRRATTRRCVRWSVNDGGGTQAYHLFYSSPFSPIHAAPSSAFFSVLIISLQYL